MTTSSVRAKLKIKVFHADKFCNSHPVANNFTPVYIYLCLRYVQVNTGLKQVSLDGN